LVYHQGSGEIFIFHSSLFFVISKVDGIAAPFAWQK